MKRWLSIIMAAGLLLYPFATCGSDYGSHLLQSQQAPPVTQPLVREGDFAIKLAATLDLGTPVNEVEAEDILAQSGIAPLNGWISDYPMTPEIIGQLDSALTKAGSEGRLPMTGDPNRSGRSFTAPSWESEGRLHALDRSARPERTCALIQRTCGQERFRTDAVIPGQRSAWQAITDARFTMRKPLH